MCSNKNDTSISVGGISNVSGGQINVAGRDISTVQSNANRDEIERAFVAIMNVIDKMPEGPEKTISQTALRDLKDEAEKGERVDRQKVERWLKFLAQTAPDAFDVVVDTLVHPIKGISTVFRKIVQRSRESK